ncbi:hypothetical protein EDD27_7946 [Nonomuraea polychroma]|uniref:DUF4386 domain-containing protein n=1 Tax=Nonomuraea polychroma TaxID=46176 RepID=A0A438MHP2_9ACTN|nr:hypothetical protein [Nonomuraea polychroma]RVX45166.1 hypothetical protein EDD27_7946 [Nonomuraea polychroma]
MSPLSDPTRLRRLAAGMCLIAAPVTYVAGILADPALRLGGSADAVGAYGRHLEQVSLSAAILHWSWVLLVPGVIGMIHLVRRRAVLLGHIAGALALLGVVNFSALMLGDFFYARLERELGPATGATLGDQALADPGAVFGFQIPGFAGVAGVFLLGLVLAYGRHAPWWAPFAMVAGMFTAPIFWVGTVVGGLLYLAGSGAIGMRMIRMTDSEWAHPGSRGAGPDPEHDTSGADGTRPAGRDAHQATTKR